MTEVPKNITAMSTGDALALPRSLCNRGETDVFTVTPIIPDRIGKKDRTEDSRLSRRGRCFLIALILFMYKDAMIWRGFSGFSPEESFFFSKFVLRSNLFYFIFLFFLFYFSWIPARLLSY